ncbi:MAG: metallophosphoesterase [Clostridiales bacterium]|nr:metallophosphoesterase [Clostridiales bacterium]
MRKKSVFSKAVALILFASFFISCFSFSSYAAESFEMSADEWNAYYLKYKTDGADAFMSPGKDESERNFSWYSGADQKDGHVEVSLYPDMKDAKRFYGSSVKTFEGDVSNKVTVSGLKEDTKYYYRCCTSSFKTDVASFKTDSGSDFSAVYVTDVHISYDPDNDIAIRDNAYTFHKTLAAAKKTDPDISLLLSAGDQASGGLREEYEGFVASPVMSTLSFAPAVGNHDKKNIAYKTFTNNPNEYKNCIISSYIGYDYWFVKGDVLFLVLDTNNPSAVDHRNFVKQAVKQNPDVKWRVAMFHHDLFGGRTPGRESETKLLRLLNAPVMDEFGIDLVLLGHSHYYTISNVIYDRKTVLKTSDVNSVKDAAGTIYMVSGSINHPRMDVDAPVGENAGKYYDTDDVIYNILSFSDGAIKIDSYTLNGGEHFESFEIQKTSENGGHPQKYFKWYMPFVRFISLVYGYFEVLSVKFKYFRAGLLK